MNPRVWITAIPLASVLWVMIFFAARVIIH